jgi:predicted GNAT superfamily acetyltransferase
VTRKEFVEECREIAVKLDVELTFYDEEKGRGASRSFEDDGFLHVVFRGKRACFTVNVNDDPVRQNDLTREILKGLGRADEIGDNTLVDETDDDVCGECGRPH